MISSPFSSYRLNGYLELLSKGEVEPCRTNFRMSIVRREYRSAHFAGRASRGLDKI